MKWKTVFNLTRNDEGIVGEEEYAFVKIYYTGTDSNYSERVWYSIHIML